MQLVPDLLAGHESAADVRSAVGSPQGPVHSLTARRQSRDAPFGKNGREMQSPVRLPWDPASPPPTTLFFREKKSAAPSAVLIKGCDVGRQLSLLETIPESSHHLPRAICLAGCVTPLFKNTSRLVCGKRDDRLVHSGRVAKCAAFFFLYFCLSARKSERNRPTWRFLSADFPGESAC